METLVILLFILLAALILSFRSSVFRRIDQLEEQILHLRQELSRSTLRLPGKAEDPEVLKRPVTGDLPIAPEKTSPTRSPILSERLPDAQSTPTTARQPATEEPVPSKPPLFPKPPTATSTTVTPPGATPPTAAPPSKKPGFFERHPDLEKFIGENLISKIGIAVLVLAIGFFVKYAIDNDWIGPAGRVAVGLVCGGILVGLAHSLRKNYAAFSSILVGGGLAIFYFTIALAYHQYHLFSQTVSFIIMLVITAFAVLLSLLYDRQELAIVALAGGFVAPFLVSNGSGNYQVLFSYLLVLIVGLLGMAYNKAWRLLNGLAFGFTVILFASWLFTLPYDAPASTYRGGFLFATTFFILFFLINIAHNIRERKKFIASDFGILLLNTCLYFAAGLYLLAQMGISQYQGLFSACMGAFNLITSYFLFRKKSVDSNILYLLIGITLSFISLTAPLQLHGHYITLFWASESVLLYWLYGKSQIRILGVACSVIWAAMLISLLMDWTHIYLYEDILFEPVRRLKALPIVFNKGFITGFYSAIACGLLFWFRRGKRWASWSLLACALVLFFNGALEILYQFNFFYPYSEVFVLYEVLYGFGLAILLVHAGSRWNWFKNYNYPGAIVFICLVVYLFLIPESFYLQNDLFASGPSAFHFVSHWISDGLLILLLVRLVGWLRSGKLHRVSSMAITPWLLCAFLVTFFSAEVLLLLNSMLFSKVHSMEEIQRVYVKAGLPIVWGLCSFLFMWLGMRHGYKPLRILSLVLFSVTLLKLFLFDIRNIPVAGKIAAFFSLGILLLVVSFMYQRLKKIIIEDEKETV